MRIKRCDNLNTHVIKSVADDLKMLLFKADLKQKKCPGHDLCSDQIEKLKIKQECTAKMLVAL